MNRKQLPKFEVRQVAYGQGLFTNHYYLPGIILGEVTGELIDDPLYSSETCVDMGDSLSLEIDPPFCYLNHNCQPNCELVVYEEETIDSYNNQMETPASPVSTLYLETIREIATDEQLTIDYAWSAEVAIRCQCESPRCRGWIVDEEELPKLLLLQDLDRDFPSHLVDEEL